MPDITSQRQSTEQHLTRPSLTEPFKDKALREFAGKARPESTITDEETSRLRNPGGQDGGGLSTEEVRRILVTALRTSVRPASSPSSSSPSDPKLSNSSHFNRSPNTNDPEGVYLCKRPAQIAMGLVNHHWIYTKNLEVGLGNCDGTTAGNQSDVPYVAETCVNNHANEIHGPETVCTKVEGVEASCISSRAIIGASNGRWTLVNNCQSWSASILEECRTALPVRPMAVPGPIPTHSE